MTRIALDATFDAPAAEVWKHVETIERHVDWMADADSVEFEGAQTRGVGTRFAVVTRVGPITLVDKLEVTEWVDGEALAIRHSGVVTGTGRFSLEPNGPDRTVFHWEEELHFPWYLGGPLGSGVGGPLVLKRIWRGNLARLKAIVEQR